MLPSCGLFSVNLLMKMPAKDSNHLKNRFEKEKCLYSHCFLSGCCLLWLAGKMSGLKYSFTLKFFLSGDSYGFLFSFSALPFALLSWILLIILFIVDSSSKCLFIHHMQMCCVRAKRTVFSQNARLEIQRPVIWSHLCNNWRDFFWTNPMGLIFPKVVADFEPLRSLFLQTWEPAVCQEIVEEQEIRWCQKFG